ncbi:MULTISPECIES: DUF3443 domain-containing protein [Paraburkholderia]|jgi:hypothetical protein|uniref:DUF3443 domain-containing protein n=1 Tax=Paraburkholderia aspalathi TaxID=1324617 RepID=A0ABM8S468_9BURK|nr:MULTISPECIES: DUF3443 domain-containing protein [Paraburkholderia]MBK3820831.1 DUF3443 domain-containing protein [Paraburkholderia aspalathi]MBK3832620.1 DUF3443 domain-containing protein [Paraburkholderia aspalathi]MBK3862365.1 DUF3443 domain-containing protein [Paraburkholderia aspalathi]MCX4158071.1 DUF3443 domain-containing protein [Paraburkholderia aspalathi]MDN7167473.1 DUF3443 domain-containing protein [Paraburkholderia sp. SECH2]
MRTMQSAVKLRGWVQAVVAVALVSVIAACGGGGGGDSSSSSNSSSTTLNGGSLPASPTQQPIAATAANTVAITVGRGVNGVINIPTVSVTVCPPGTTSNCQTINNIQVDTGSFGLRLVSSVLNSSLLNGGLPISTLASGAQLAECATFADGFTWGTVRTATIQIGGETTASPIPIQIIGDSAAGAAPSGCGSGSAENTASDLGANGILGIGTAPNDCGATCANAGTATNYSNYFTCGTSCARATVPLSQQVANPVANFTADNNGVIVQMPPVSNTGASSATGTLVFGIGTQSNNALAATQTFTTDAFGNMNNSVFNGTTVQAFFDSGSNAYFFADSSLAQCGSNFAGFYCPSSAQTRSITLGGLSSTRASASIGILSASTLFSNTSNYAFNDLAGQIGGNSSFDLGLPFFYGRYMYYGFATSTQAPYVGF